MLTDGVIAGNSGGAEYGVFLGNTSGALTHGVRVQRCDISGCYSTSKGDYGAEIFVNGVPSGLDGVSVLNNTLHGSSGPTSPDDNGVTGYGQSNNITGVLYQGNTVFDIGGKAGGISGAEGNGILVNGANGAVVQYNVVYRCGGNTTTCGGPAGIWAYTANNVTIQYNEVYGMAPAGPAGGGCDGNAYDLDGQLKGPGSGGTIGGYGPGSLSGYLLQASSPLRGAGLDLKAAFGIDPGPVDFFGQEIPSGHGSGDNVGADGSP